MNKIPKCPEIPDIALLHTGADADLIKFREGVAACSDWSVAVCDAVNVMAAAMASIDKEVERIKVSI